MKNFAQWFVRPLFLTLAACASTPQVNQPMSSQNPSGERTPSAINGDSSRGYIVEWCSRNGALDAHKDYQLIISGGPTVDGHLNASGCIKAREIPGLSPGQNIVYRVDGQNRDSETVPKGFGSTTGVGGPTPIPQPVPTPAPTPVPIPQRQPLDILQVQQAAEKHAKCTAKAVVGLYGRFENFRYNYYVGFRDGLGLYANVNQGDMRNTADYQSASATGARDGMTQGASAGGAQGSSDASIQAANDVMARYAAVIDMNQAPDLTKHGGRPSFQGLASNLPVPPTIDQRVATFGSAYRTKYLQMNMGYDGDVIDANSWRDEWAITNFYRWGQYDFNSVLELYKAGWAYDSFRARRFNRCAQDVDYYSDISNSTIYSNTDVATSTYVQTFKEMYRLSIDKKLINAIQAPDLVSQNYGRNDGFGIYQSYVRDLGYSNGYSNAYSQSSIDSYNGSYAVTYDQSFDREVQKYEQNAVIHFDQGQVVDLSGQGKQNLVVGMPVGVRLLKVTNFGRQPGDFKVSVTGPGIDSPVYRMVHIDPSSTLKQNQSVMNLGFVGHNLATVPPDGQVNVTINFGQAQQSDAFQNNWDNLMAAFAVQPAGPVMNNQSDYIYNVCLEEIKRTYDGAIHLGNPWGKDDRSFRLIRLSHFAQGLPAAQRANFRGIAAKLLAHLGPNRPGFFSGSKGSEYDSLKQWISHLQ